MEAPRIGKQSQESGGFLTLDAVIDSILQGDLFSRVSGSKLRLDIARILAQAILSEDANVGDTRRWIWVMTANQELGVEVLAKLSSKNGVWVAKAEHIDSCDYHWHRTDGVCFTQLYLSALRRLEKWNRSGTLGTAPWSKVMRGRLALRCGRHTFAAP